MFYLPMLRKIAPMLCLALFFVACGGEPETTVDPEGPDKTGPTRLSDPGSTSPMYFFGFRNESGVSDDSIATVRDSMHGQWYRHDSTGLYSRAVEKGVYPDSTGEWARFYDIDKVKPLNHRNMRRMDVTLQKWTSDSIVFDIKVLTHHSFEWRPYANPGRFRMQRKESSSLANALVDMMATCAFKFR